MRLWSIDPKYLDSKGLVALWREGLLAKKVLEGRTTGYKNHPQLIRFINSSNCLEYINAYLHIVCDEADRRNYNFDRTKLSKRVENLSKLTVKSGQVDYEVQHLLSKLMVRDLDRYEKLKDQKRVLLHALFKRAKGGIESWEIVKDKSL